MSAQLFDFLQQPLPLRLRRAYQLQTDAFEQTLVDDFAMPLDYPASSAPERCASTERLLYARRRSLESSPA